ncbi:hypothetical protein F2P81_006815 [Scophthalmus maximus]|uniref:YAP binding domain-containing protein n=1 Tax=Scophthalmus maximus TaxID=52904 RepID=A0A6A4T427_SCOMX|nr:hypothetical protein F2P81_006815 [Scophthalmus maximus]
MLLFSPLTVSGERRRTAAAEDGGKKKKILLVSEVMQLNIVTSSQRAAAAAARRVVAVSRLPACSQVSSHIQVLARRKSREFQSKLKDQSAKEKALQSISSMSSAQIVSATAIHSKLLPGIVRASFPGNAQTKVSDRRIDEMHFAASEMFAVNVTRLSFPWRPRLLRIIKPFSQQAYSVQTAGTTTISGYEPPTSAQTHREPAWQGRSIGTTKLRLVEFSSFLETQRDQEAYNKHLFVHINQSSLSYSDPLLECVDIRQIYDKFPEKKGGLKELFAKGPQNAFYLIKFWADLNYSVQDDPAAFYGVSSQYESSENMTITCSTKVCSFGKQVVEKVETEYARFENGRFVYRINRSPMCEYMINFIHKLKHLPEKYMMNSVLENFTILLRARRVIGGLACSRTPRLVGVNICTGPSLAGRQRHVTVHFVSDDIDDSNDRSAFCHDDPPFGFSFTTSLTKDRHRATRNTVMYTKSFVKVSNLPSSRIIVVVVVVVRVSFNVFSRTCKVALFISFSRKPIALERNLPVCNRLQKWP